ncbi:MAG: hypothetical protein R2832_14990 [Rhodothermales bacterium]
MLVILGGGYRVVCMDHEGKAIARWLNSIGITAGVLKYRSPNVHYGSVSGCTAGVADAARKRG